MSSLIQGLSETMTPHPTPDPVNLGCFPGAWGLVLRCHWKACLGDESCPQRRPGEGHVTPDVPWCWEGFLTWPGPHAAVPCKLGPHGPFPPNLGAICHPLETPPQTPAAVTMHGVSRSA